MSSVHYTVLSDRDSSTVKHSFPESSVKNCTVKSLPKFPPILTDKWLVHIKVPRDLVVMPEFVKQVQAVQNICVYVFFCSSEEVAIYLERQLNCKRLDRRIRSPSDLYDYIKSRLNISDTTTKELLKLSKNYAPRVLRNVDTLAMLGTDVRITNKVLERHIANHSASFEDIYQNILYKKPNKSARTLALQQIGHYNKAPNLIWSYLLKRVTQDIQVLRGDIELDNHMYPTYQVDLVLSLSGSLSLETLYQWKAFLLSCKKLKVTTGYIKFIREVRRIWG